MKHATTTSKTFAAGKDTYLVFPPVPGLMFMSCEVDQGAQPRVFSPTFHNEATLTGFTSFRFASNVVGLYPTSNFSNFGGSIVAFKTQITFSDASYNYLTDSTNTIKGESPRLTGAVISTTAPQDNFAVPFIDGVYIQALNLEPTFPFTLNRQYTEISNYARKMKDPPDNGENEIHWGFGGRVVSGMGNLECIVIKVNTPANAVNSAIIKSWQCLEVIPSSSESTHKFMSESPPYDPVALALYRQLAKKLPMAVVSKENAHSWERVSAIILELLKAGAYLPGALGILSGGLGIAMTGLRDLTI